MPFEEVQRTRVVCHNSKTNTDYVYDSIVLRDTETNQKTTKRKLVGKLDDDGNLVPTGHVGRPRQKNNSAIFNPVPTGKDGMASKGDTLGNLQEQSLSKVVSALHEIEHSIATLESQIRQLLSEIS